MILFGCDGRIDKNIERKVSTEFECGISMVLANLRVLQIYLKLLKLLIEIKISIRDVLVFTSVNNRINDDC